MSELKEVKKEISRKMSRLYYITHKDEINKKRKKYKRQAWKDRADNPRNKK